jgi:pimeloyl-ACP methyl ester carboxylesterase
MRPISVSVDGLQLGGQGSGDSAKPALVLLHGWPQSSLAWTGVLDVLAEDSFVLAFDLPDVGLSAGAPASADKTELARLILKGATSLGARDIIIAGYDVGGMVAFAAARDHTEQIAGAVVMNTVVPGIDPWSAILADPRIWHFAFHALPDLPELLVAGRQRKYFDYFYDLMAKDPAALSDAARDAYAAAYERPASLKAGFDWYRAMAQDAERNGSSIPIDTPLLYLRGDADGREPTAYVVGLRAAGARNITWGSLPNSGEYVAEEAPEAFIEAVRGFRSGLGKKVQ